MNTSITQAATAFNNTNKLANGPLIEVIMAMKTAIIENQNAKILCFLDENGAMIDFDLSGSNEQIIARLLTQFKAPSTSEQIEIIETQSKAGRPKLGVIAKEVTLLPRHWEWLGAQNGGASATLRRLVEIAAKESIGIAARKNAQNATYRFLQNIAGDFENYEEVLRAIFADDFEKMRNLMKNWPQDIQNYAQKLFALSPEPLKE